MKVVKKINYKKIDIAILFIVTILICVGLFCSRQAYMFRIDKNIMFVKQIMGVTLGYILMFLVMIIDYKIICKFSFPFYIAINLTLAYTLLFGTNLNGVKRWITIFGFQIQPSEITKVVIILFLAFLCNHFKNKTDKFYVLFLQTIAVLIPMILIFLEPHLSSCIALLFIFFIQIYASGLSYKLIGKVIAVVIPIAIIILISVTQFNVNIPFIQKYQIKRVTSFMSSDESEDLSGNYQQNQSLNAIASGGLNGKLISINASNRQYDDIYAKESDFVFAIVGEEFGFIGSFIIVILYSILIIKCLIISARASDYVGKLICIGVSAYVMFQFFVNVGVAITLLPNTGLPLPFISSGLTSLVSSMIAIGLVLNVQLREKVTNK